MRIILWIILVICASNFVYAQIANDVYLNGKIFTADDKQPFVQAIAVKDGAFIYVGSQVGAGAYIGTSTTVHDLNGRLVIPGIHDVHMHPLEASSSVAGLCELDSEDPEQLGEILRDCNLEVNANGWIFTGGHSIYTLYEANRDPKEILDDYFPDHPIVIIEETSHSVWVNSAALDELNITSATEDPPGGHVFKNEKTGEPTGILMDNAGDIALDAALDAHPDIDQLNYEGLIEYGLPLIAENGITSICEGRTYWKRNYINIWKRIKNNDLLTVRVNLAPWVYPSDLDAIQVPIIRDLYEEGDDMLRVNQIKLYSDGIVINAAAALHEPYLENFGLPFDRGLNYIEASRLAQLITTLELDGYDFHIHAIGDRGVTEAIDAIQAARQINGDIGARHRITHVEIVDPDDFARFAPLNITADMQVAGDFTNPDHWHENDFLLGSERTLQLVPVRSIYETGARVTLSSDWDVSSLSPFVGIQNAVTRAPEQLPSVAEAIKSYTIRAAYVMRQDDITGSIEVGKLADFICVDQDIFAIPPTQIGTTKVLQTFLGGEEIYRSPLLSSVDVVEDNKLIILKNPVHDQLMINVKNIEAISYKLFSTDGSLIREGRIHSGTSTLDISMVNYVAGVYIIEVITKDGERFVSSFVKE